MPSSRFPSNREENHAQRYVLTGSIRSAPRQPVTTTLCPPASLTSPENPACRFPITMPHPSALAVPGPRIEMVPPEPSRKGERLPGKPNSVAGSAVSLLQVKPSRSMGNCEKSSRTLPIERNLIQGAVSIVSVKTYRPDGISNAGKQDVSPVRNAILRMKSMARAKVPVSSLAPLPLRENSSSQRNPFVAWSFVDSILPRAVADAPSITTLADTPMAKRRLLLISPACLELVESRDLMIISSPTPW